MAIDWDAALLGPTMAVFGETVTYRPIAGAAKVVTDAVFDAQYSRVTEDKDGNPVNVTSPILGIRAVVIASPQQGDRVDVPSVRTRFAVSDVQPDGHGHFLLILRKAADL